MSDNEDVNTSNDRLTIKTCQNDDCKEVIHGRNKTASISCDRCDKWICIKCEQLTTKDITIIDKTVHIDGLSYECKGCKIIYKELKEKYDSIEK